MNRSVHFDSTPSLLARKRGFTLVEVVIASTIALLVVGAVVQTTLTVGRILFDSTAKLEITRDIRGFTSHLSRDTWSARDYRIFAAPEDLTARFSGQTGDVLALIWAVATPLETAVAGSDYDYFYDRIIIYARMVDDEAVNTGPVMRYERRFNLPGASGGGTRASQTSIADLVADILDSENLDNQREIVEITRGLADERLFFHSRTGRSITLNGEIYHGNAARQVSNTYNFTINPRG